MASAYLRGVSTFIHCSTIMAGLSSVAVDLDSTAGVVVDPVVMALLLSSCMLAPLI